MNSIIKEAAAEVASAGAQTMVAHWGTRLAARLVPGTGWALLAYDGISLGGAAYETVTGNRFSDTAVGSVATKYTDAVDKVATTAGNAAFTGVSNVLSFVGMTKASQFVSNDARYFIMGDNAKPADPAAVAMAKTQPTKAVDHDLPIADACAPTRADREKIAHPGATSRSLTLGEATTLVDTPTGRIDPDRARNAQTRIASLISASQEPSTLDQIAALAIAAKSSAPPASGRRANSSIELG